MSTFTDQQKRAIRWLRRIGFLPIEHANLETKNIYLIRNDRFDQASIEPSGLICMSLMRHEGKSLVSRAKIIKPI